MVSKAKFQEAEIVTSQASNPFSSGGGGHFFEAKVQAAFLLHLLIGGRVPCLPTGTVQSVRLQAKQAGFNTDDVVVTVRTDSGTEHRLLAQVKHRAAVTASDTEFRDTLASAWADFNNPNAFAQGKDAIAIVTGPQSDRAIQHVRPLLDWARTSASSAEYFSKVATAHFSSDAKRGYLGVFRGVLTQVAGSAPDDEALWRFLRSLYLLSYDFDAQGSKDEAAILTVLDLARNQTGGLDAQGIWEGLVHQAQEWNKTAGTYTPAQLTERLRAAVQPRRSQPQRDAISRLEEHSKVVLAGISTELAPGISLSREAVFDTLAEAVESSRIVVVQGPPGSGKSAIVKMLFERLANGVQPFAFKAQEFNHPHIHQFLISVGIPISLEQLRCEFSMLPRKILLVDGAERLFELSSHEAFRHLLQQLRGDDSWTVVITCREASAEALREHLLSQWGDETTTVSIPTLNAKELAWVAGQAPHLATLIANPRLERLLRLPFILSLAWRAFPASSSNEVMSNIDERQFKDIVWCDYVERVAQKQGGMPIKRCQCLLTISVERARRMSLFVAPMNCDAEALQVLVEDSILVESKTGGYAPSHDVIEDWAIARFIAREFETKAGSPIEFTHAVGTEPAMRRGFRLWMSDALAGNDSQRVLDFAFAAYRRDDVPPVWRDEIAVAVLHSERAGNFIQSAEQQLLADNKALYRRLVHVLRTACKGPNESLLRTYGLAAFRSHEVLASVFVMPVGAGWRELILFTHRRLEDFDLDESSTVLGLLKDWAQGLSLSDPLPPEATAAAQICLKYWGLLTAPDVTEFLTLLFKIPQAAKGDVEAFIRAALEGNQTRHYHCDTILEYVTKSLECQPLCAHFPQLVIEVADRTWHMQPNDRDHYGYRLDLDELFGLKHSVRFHYHPESALQGPFPFLLASHPDLAVDFMVRLVNDATEHYVKSRIGHEARNVVLFAGTTTRPVIGSYRLWCMYRGMMPGPQVMECALMALEAWHLNQAKQGANIRAIFRKILESSTSAATLGVLVSVALAYPQALDEEVLPLLGVREFYQWDFDRSYEEQSHVTDVRPMLGAPTGGIEEIYYKERKDSAALPHRKTNLEELAFRLQLTPLRDRVWAILDRLNAELPPENEQSEGDKTWRIALHRMDIRHFKAEKGREPGEVLLTPGEPAPDLQEYIENAAQEFAPRQRRMTLTAWGIARFRGDTPSPDSFPDWRDAFAEARSLSEQASSACENLLLDRSGAVFVAAYSIRDHFQELSHEELEWCRKVLIDEVRRKDEDRTFDTRISKNPFDGSRPAALVLPLLLRNVTDEPTRSGIEDCLAVAVTHTSEEVRDYAAEGVRAWLWDIDAALAKACAGGLFELAGAENLIRSQGHRSRVFSQEEHERAVWAVTKTVRGQIVKRETVGTLSAPAVDLKAQDWPELLDALSMVRPEAADPDLRAFVMASLSALLLEAEAAEEWKSESRGDVSYEFQLAFAKLFARFTLARSADEARQIGELLVGYVERCPRYLGVLLELLLVEEDRIRSGPVFWNIWKSVFAPIFRHHLLRGPERIWRYDEMRKLVRVLLFADVEFKEGINEWAPVTEHRDFFKQAAAAVGNTPAGFGALVSILNSVGQVFLPEAILWLGHALERAQGTNLLQDRNADFDLEVLLRKVCYGYGIIIRQRPELHRAVLALLDRLVERGSHTGFRLRDYIVAPLPVSS
jgi:hypothetical protein